MSKVKGEHSPPNQDFALAISECQATLEATTDGIVVTDAEGRITRYNQNFLDIWPITKDLFDDPTYGGLIQALNRVVKDPEQFHNRIGEILKNPPPETHDEIEMVDGRIFERFSRIQKVGGDELGRVWTFRDVTEQRRVEAELRQQREWFQVTLSSIGDAVITTDTFGAVTFLNPIAEFLTGWKSADAMGKPLETVFNIINEGTRQPVETPVARVLAEGIIVGLANHTVLIAKDGQETAIDDSAAPIRDSSGKISGVVMVFHDVSERRRADEAQRESRERLSAALNAASIGTFRWNILTGSLLADANLERLMRQPGGDHFQSLADFIACAHPEDRSILDLALRQCAREGGVFQLQFRVQPREGEVRWLDANGKTYEDELGRQAFVTGACADITERRRAEEESLTLAAIVQSSDDAIISKSLDGIVQSWNQGAQRIFGYQADEVVGKHISLLIPDDRQDEEPRILARLQRGERIDHYETIRRRKDGELLDISLSVSPLKNSRGEIIGASKIARDITGRKRAEKALKESQSRTALAMEAGQMGEWDWIIPENRVIWSTTFEVIHGREPGTFGGTFEDALRDIHPEDRERVMAEVQKSLAEKTGLRLEYRVLRPDGKLAWMEVRGRLFLDAKGEPERMAGVGMDITARKEAEAELRSTVEALHTEYSISEELYAVAKALSQELDLETIVQLITDAGTRVTRAEFGAFFYNVLDQNGASYMLYTLSGVPREAFEKFPMPRATALFGPTFRGEGVIRLDDVRQDPRFGKSAPYHGMPAGHLPVVSYLAVPVTSRTGEVMGGLFFGHSEAGVFNERDERVVTGIAAQAAAAMDTARLYQAEQTARAASEQANRMKDDFLAALSHELRTPLTPVLAILYNLRQQKDIPESALQDLDAVRRNVELEARLIDDLLDLTRITRGKMELRREVVPLAKAIRDAISTCEPELRAKGLRLVQEFDGLDIVLNADQARVTQIVWNLLKNAIKFTPPNGEITVRVESDRDVVRISVEDTGIGIEEERLQKVFDAFEQGGREITRQFGGLGLGLAISKALAEAHQGDLEAASPGVGRGSTFTLSLPLTQNPVASAPAEITPVEPSSPPQEDLPPVVDHVNTLLLVEDHADTAIVFSRILRSLGYKVRHAETISAALQIAEVEMAEGGVDLVISDLGLPDGSGNDLMRELSLRYGLRGIALSGYGMDTDLEASTAAGFSRHLIKPVDIDELRTAIREALGTT